MSDAAAIERRFKLIGGMLDERLRRCVAGAGLKVRAALDRNTYPAGIKVDKKAVADIQLKPAGFHGDWNYTILPSRRRD